MGRRSTRPCRRSSRGPSPATPNASTFGPRTTTITNSRAGQDLTADRPVARAATPKDQSLRRGASARFGLRCPLGASCLRSPVDPMASGPTPAPDHFSRSRRTSGTRRGGGPRGRRCGPPAPHLGRNRVTPGVPGRGLDLLVRPRVGRGGSAWPPRGDCGPGCATGGPLGGRQTSTDHSRPIARVRRLPGGHGVPEPHTKWRCCVR